MIVFDFDGTATLAEEEAAPFEAAYRADLAALFRVAQAELDPRIDALLAQIQARPAEFAFHVNGRAVCPASVDPYLRMGAVLDALAAERGVLRDDEDRSRVAGGLLYRKNYELTLDRPAFRPEARDVFEALRGRPVYVVTNSGTHHVRAKVERLGVPWLAERVYGNARKFVVDDTFDRVPAALHLAGLDRPVYLRRRAYHDLLDQLRREVGCDWRDVTVVGDIFELDLCLPQALGARVVQIEGPATPPWERDHLARTGHLVRSLDAVLPLLA